MENNLQNKIESILNNGVGVNLYFALRNQDQVVIKRADLETGETQNNLRRQFISLLETEIVESQDCEVEELSSTDERNNIFYHYDYLEFPEKLQYFAEFDYQKEYDMFSFGKDDLSKIEAYIIVLGSREHYCVLYKKFYPVFLIGRGSYFLKLKSKSRFSEFDEDIIRISKDYHFLMVDGEIYIKDLKILEQYGGFKKVIESEAEQTLEEIEKMDLLEETEGLSETIKENLSFARKLGKIRKTSPVISLHIPNNQVIEFSKTHPGIKGKLRYSEDGNKILLTTKKSQEEFLKLLDDSFLISELTKYYYASMTKKKV